MAGDSAIEENLELQVSSDETEEDGVVALRNPIKTLTSERIARKFLESYYMNPLQLRSKQIFQNAADGKYANSPLWIHDYLSPKLVSSLKSTNPKPQPQINNQNSSDEFAWDKSSNTPQLLH